MSAGNALTAIKGGINRMRIKGAARQDALYNLLNGYVTVGNTIKVRGGTFRSTNLAPTTGALATKGLVAYAGSRHVFSEKSVAVPAGYTLHVLNHPAATYNPVNVTITPVTASWVASAIGYQGFCDGISTSAAHGTKTPAQGSYTPQFVYGAKVAAIWAQTSGAGNFAVTLYGNLPQNFFNSVTMNGNEHDTSTASYFQYVDDQSNTMTEWVWGNPGAPFRADMLLNYPWLFDQTFQQIIPLKEIHFAAPFMGFLYVSAEFTTDGGSGLGTVFHYLIQTSGTWAASTVYSIGQVVSPTVPNGFTYKAVRISPPNPGWAAHTLHNDGDIIEPTVPNGYFFTQTSHLGTSPQTGTVEPTWPTSEGQTVKEDSESDDNSVVTNAAPQPASNQPSAGTGTKYTNPYLVVG